jgi:hypothetical protein
MTKIATATAACKNAFGFIARPLCYVASNKLTVFDSLENLHVAKDESPVTDAVRPLQLAMEVRDQSLEHPRSVLLFTASAYIEKSEFRIPERSPYVLVQHFNAYC